MPSTWVVVFNVDSRVVARYRDYACFLGIDINRAISCSACCVLCFVFRDNSGVRLHFAGASIKTEDISRTIEGSGPEVAVHLLFISAIGEWSIRLYSL